MKIKYRFIFADGKEESFDLTLDPDTLAYQPDPNAVPPEWTRLENHKCRNCPLAEAEHPHCPVARNLAPVIARFVNHISFEEADVVVETDVREYRKRVSLQKSIASLFGLIMTTSGCPALDKLRPMTFTHLPVGELEETRYRAISMYLMAQYFRASKGLSADWELKGLEKINADIGLVNRDFIERVRSMNMEDANLNAIVGLDCFRLGSGPALTRALQKLERIFQNYL